MSPAVVNAVQVACAHTTGSRRCALPSCAARAPFCVASPALSSLHRSTAVSPVQMEFHERCHHHPVVPCSFCATVCRLRAPTQPMHFCVCIRQDSETTCLVFLCGFRAVLCPSGSTTAAIVAGSNSKRRKGDRCGGSSLEVCSCQNCYHNSYQVKNRQHTCSQYMRFDCRCRR